MMSGNDSAFNSLNPFVTSEPSYYSTFLMGNVGGALTKTSSWFGSIFRRDNQSNSIINAELLDASGNPYNYSAAVANPQTRLDMSPRFDFQLGSKNTLTVRYSLDRQTATNSGVSLFALQSQAYNTSGTENTVQLSDTQVLSDHVVNETRFQFAGDRNSQAAQSTDPAVIVQGAFTGGGNTMGVNRDNQNRFELQNDTIVSRAHTPSTSVRVSASRATPTIQPQASTVSTSTPRSTPTRPIPLRNSTSPPVLALQPSTTLTSASSTRTTSSSAPTSRSVTASAMSRRTTSAITPTLPPASPSHGRPPLTEPTRPKP